MGINNVRIMAGSEGPNEEPFRMKPALMKEPNVYDESVFEGKRKGGIFLMIIMCLCIQVWIK